ncbi:hypothetical protein HY448_00825 [Candidatus Pacearchaeota archaeon]|nr:hypothetical protein [Candidatus Pacearchaeota archaeon]
MVGIADEHDSALEMIARAYEALKRKSPEHELLSLIKISDDGKTFNFRSEFDQKFRKDTDKFWAQAYVRYANALEEAAR